MTTNNATILSKFRASKTQTVNDYTRRFGYSAGTPYMAIPPKSSGLRSACVPGGELLPFVPFPESRLGPFDKNKNIYPMITTLVAPTEQQYYVRKRFHEGNDMGYRDLDMLKALPYEVTDTSYTDEAVPYFETVHPSPLAGCPFELESVFRSRAEGNVGAEWYQACPTCRLGQLQSEATTLRIAQSPLDHEILEQLRATLIQACEASIGFANMKIDLINADIEKRRNGEPHGRTSRNEADYIYLKMAHRDLDNVAKVNEAAAVKAEADRKESLDLQRQELALRERELALREKEMAQKEKETENVGNSVTKGSKSKN